VFSSFAIRLTDFCRRFALAIVVSSLIAATGLSLYVAHTIKINTDVNQLLAAGLPWRTLEKDLEKAFPQSSDRLVIVIDGKTPDAAEDAAAKLASAMAGNKQLFKTVVRPDSISFFQTNGFLFLSEKELGSILSGLIKAQPFLGSLARDPSMRGLINTMGLTVEGIKQGEAKYEDLAPTYQTLATTMATVLSNRPAKLPWRSMMSSEAPTLRDLRKFILTQPALDYSSLAPGEKASKEVRRLVHDMRLDAAGDVTVRLTGSVALNDQEFSSVADGMTFSVTLSVLLVIGILFLALGSIRLIAPIFITLAVGLIATTAFAMAAIGSLNLISVAFAVMFVGIAVDFGIQYGVKFREEHFHEPDPAKAMRNTTQRIMRPLSFAAASTALGFLAFIPTDYRGVSELGIIAGFGMILALILNLTLLPSLLTLFKPKAEPKSVGYAWALPIDKFIQAKRKPLLIAIGVVAIVAAGIAANIHFDFDPLNMKDPKTESVSTMFDIMKDPDATPYTIQILKPSIKEAQDVADKIEKLPEVDHTITLASFVPSHQTERLAQLEDANLMLDPSLNPSEKLHAPSPADTYKVMHETAEKLHALGPQKDAAAYFAEQLDETVRRNNPAILPRFDIAMVNGITGYIAQINQMMHVKPVTVDAITDDLRHDWMTPDGRAKIEVYPKGNARDPKVLAAFTEAVRKVEPNASGTAISIQESGRTIVSAFVKAGILALIAIGLLGFSVLRKKEDVARLLAPLFLAGILTLATMVMIKLPLNFANIIALPLLLSLGVSYAIYFVTSWRDGIESPLSSSMARAVLYSAGTTLVAFGSLSLSSHPGTSGMGQLLTIALLYCLLCTFLVLPVLLGRHR